MFTLIGIVLGFVCICGLLALVDRIAYHRGLGGAHPLSPAVAYAMLIGVLILGGFILGGMALDRATLARPATPSPATGEQ